MTFDIIKVISSVRISAKMEPTSISNVFKGIKHWMAKWHIPNHSKNLFVPWKHFCYLRRISLIACVFLMSSALSCFKCKNRHITGIFYMLFPVIAEIAAVLNWIWTQISWCRPIHTEQLCLHSHDANSLSCIFLLGAAIFCTFQQVSRASPWRSQPILL